LVAALLATLLVALPAAAVAGAAKPSLSLAPAASTATVGSGLRLTGTVRNAQTGSTSVLIYEKVGSEVTRLAAARLTARHTFGAKVTPQRQGPWLLFAVYDYGTGTATAKARSDVLAITVSRAPGEWPAIAAGGYHSVALRSDGSLWAWGDNIFGQLGLGDTSDRNVPTRVGTANDWVAASAGGYHSLALKKDGSLWAWGWNHFGQLGLGPHADQLVPAEVTGGSP
jgi:hypothetical protein